MEEVKSVMEDMSELQKCIVLLLKSKNNAPIRGDRWFQKELFLIAKNVNEIEEEASFHPYKYGPWSENAEEQLNELEMDDVVSRAGKKMRLSDLGNKIADELKKSSQKDLFEIIDESKDLLNDLTDDEMLTLIYSAFPDYAEKSVVKCEIEKNRLNNAIKLYKKDKVSIQRAAEIGGVSLDKFIRDAKKLS